MDLTRSLWIRLSRWELYMFCLFVCLFFLWGVAGGVGVFFFLVFVVLISFDFLSTYLFQVFILFTVFSLAIACVSDWRKITVIFLDCVFVIFMLIFCIFLNFILFHNFVVPYVYSIGTERTESTEYYLILEFAFVESNCRSVWW